MRKANRYVKQVLCECAQAAVRTDCQYKGYFAQMKIRRGFKRSIVAVAHKQLEVIYVILTKQEPYRDPKIDYDKLMAKRNAPRWLKTLARYGYLPGMATK